jgi:uncharacterized membrane protein YphA (DoxX/SURF4 family)
MSEPRPSTAMIWPEVTSVLARLILGGLFAYMGLAKALDPVAFLKLVREYDLMQFPLLLNSTAALLPWVEVFCGLLLLAGVGVRGGAMILGGMLVPFTAAVVARAWDIHLTQAIPFCAVKFDCGCGTGEVSICGKVVENSLLLLLALWLMAKPGRRFRLHVPHAE